MPGRKFRRLSPIDAAYGGRDGAGGRKTQDMLMTAADVPTRRFRRLRLFGRAIATIALLAIPISALCVADGIRHPNRWLPLRSGRSSFPAEPSWEPMEVTAPDGVVLRGRFLPHPQSAGRTVVLLHGLRGRSDGMLGRAAALRDAFPVNVCLMDLRGHGESDRVELTYGLRERYDIQAAVSALLRRGDVAGDGIVLMGTSLGGSVALQAAAVDPRVRAVVAEAPFADLQSAISDRARRRRIPDWYASLVRGVFELQSDWKWSDVDVAAAASTLSCPVLLIHGDLDDRTPPYHSHELFRCCRSHLKRLHLVVGGGHNSLWRVRPAEYSAELRRFLVEVFVHVGARE